MTKRISFYALIGIFATYIAISCIGCSKPSSTDAPVSKTAADTIISEQFNTLYTDPAKAISNYSDAQKSVADSFDYYKIELYKAIGYQFSGNTKSMDSIWQNVKSFCQNNSENIKSQSLIAIYWNHTAVYQINSLGNRDSAITCFKNSCTAIMKSGRTPDLVGVYVNLADAYRQKGDAPLSSHYYRRAYAIADSLGEKGEFCAIFSGLAQVYTDIENYEEANRYFNKVANIIDADTSNAGISYDAYFFNISYGNSLYLQKRYADALKHFNRANVIANAFSNQELSFIARVNLGEVSLLMNNVDSAAAHLNVAQQLFSTIPTDGSKRFYLNSIMGDLELQRNHLASAHTYLSKALADSLAAGPRYLALHYMRMQDYYCTTGNFREAYHCLALSKRYNDSINNAAVRNQIAEIDYRHMQDTTVLHASLIVSQKEDEMKGLQLQVYGLIIVVILVAFASFAWIMYKRRKRIISEMQLRNMLYSQRLANMRNRISPHFVFNILNRELAANNEGINNLVKLLRMNLEMCDRYTVPLADEIAFIDAYIEDERPALGDNFTYTKHIDERVDMTAEEIPSMMIHIFVENAVKHGLRGFAPDKFLEIDIKHDVTATIISVRNNGNVTSGVRREDKTGTGMRIITQTIQILNDHNKRKIALNIDNSTSADGSQSLWTVTLTIPQGFNFRPFK